ncbi:MAG: DUF4038 domain-containing protein [Bacteroidales bacterium]|nr:DUF4038 domain-containing protein [Bacteroidales bacterium]
MTELRFESSTDYNPGGSEKVSLDVSFTHPKTGVTLVRPAFWDGGNEFLVRFAPTVEGKWKWRSVCPQDSSLDGLKGRFTCEKYDGNLPVYQHGFVKVEPGRKYMSYADGTPFFYLGDTHWGMYLEEFDAPGPNAGNTGAESHFKYIVDRRAEQGFTVYQSEPLGASFNLSDGKVDSVDIPGLRAADKYYKYIAGAGLVHANAEFFFASSMRAELAANGDALRTISRDWVARFGAFPVIWTLAQEIDNDFYSERGDQPAYDFTNNPWVKVAEYIHKYDCYSHPLSGHQENSWYTTVSGKGTGASDRDGDGASVFRSEEVAKRTGHNWWAAQWSPSLTGPVDPGLVRDYWESSRPAVNYEGRYCGLWTKDFGSRVQGWISFLSGFFGYGYGAIDIWLYRSDYDVNTESFDGVEHITPADKMKPWSESIEYPSAIQMGYLRSFMESFDWWNLTPVLNDEEAFKADASGYVYARTSDTHVLYFFSKETTTGEITDIQAGNTFRLSWYNPRSGEWSNPVNLTSSEEGRLVLPEKPDFEDWVLMIR